MRAINASQVLVMIPTWHTIWGMVVCFKTLANQTILDLSYRMGDLAVSFYFGGMALFSISEMTLFSGHLRG